MFDVIWLNILTPNTRLISGKDIMSNNYIYCIISSYKSMALKLNFLACFPSIYVPITHRACMYNSNARSLCWWLMMTSVPHDLIDTRARIAHQSTQSNMHNKTNKVWGAANKHNLCIFALFNLTDLTDGVFVFIIYIIILIYMNKFKAIF